MSVDKTMKDHMDAVRGVTGAVGLLSMAAATDALKSFNGIKHITQQISLNGFRSNGIYEGIGNKMSNKPGGIADNDEVVIINLTPTDSYTVQFLFVNALVWLRFYLHEAWTAWSKIGGVLNPVLSAIKHMVAPLMGGVAYVA